MASQEAILNSEFTDEKQEYSLRIENLPMERKYCGLSKGRFALAVVAVLLVILVIILLLVFFLKTHSTKSGKGGSHSSTSKCNGQSLPSFPLILISMDGFRPDYLNRNITPNINNLARHGVRAKFMESQFPTKTFPNHYSIITGLFASHHGIVSNRFKDDVLNASFALGNPLTLNPMWWSGEPLWVTAIKQGLVSAAYFWVGSDVPTQGILPNYTFVYNQSHPFATRVDKILSWLDLPPQGSEVDPKEDDGKRRPSFITLYFHEPDYTAHRQGPDSAKTNEKIKLVDDMIGKLWKGLTERHIENKINIILLSDHGMTTTSCSRVLFLDKYNVTVNDVDFPQGFGGAFIAMNPKPGVSAEEVVSRLKCQSRHMQFFLKEDLPKRLHYSNNRRIGKVIGIPEDGWLIGINSTVGYRYCNGGTHGYDNQDLNMRGLLLFGGKRRRPWTLFVAHGPSFKNGEVVDHFQNIELYNLMAGVLGIKPAPNDGTPGSLLHLLDPCVNIVVPEPKSDGNVMRTDTCRYPGDAQAAKRRECKLCVCPYCQVNLDDDVPRFDKMLDLSHDQETLLLKKHLPWGVPTGGAGRGGCILTQQDFITGYSTYLHLPLWVAYRLDGEKSSQFGKRRNCYRRDVRLTDAQASKCSHYYRSSFDRGHMAPNGDFDSEDEGDETVMNSFVLSNIAPQYRWFNAGIWLVAENIVRNLSVAFSSIFVISGAIFDENADGLRDDDKNITKWLKNDSSSVAIPSHYYKIIVRCDASKKPYYKVPGCEGRLDVISFVLPHLPSRPCSKVQSASEYMFENVATVRDIELLTGINFFSQLPPAEQARIKTISPAKLWI